MNNLKTHLNTEASRIRLTGAEKAEIRATLSRITMGSVTSPYARFFAPRSFAYAFVALLVVSSGTAYAAQGALPGSPLYAIKINMNERVETALAVTPEAKIQVNAKLAERRIDEIKTLAEQGTLDASTTLEAETNFDLHSSQIEAVSKESTHQNTDAKIAIAKISSSVDTLSPTEPDKTAVTAKIAEPMTMHAAALRPLSTTTATSSEESNHDDKASTASVPNTIRKNSNHFLEHVRARMKEIEQAQTQGDTVSGDTPDPSRIDPTPTLQTEADVEIQY